MQLIFGIFNRYWKWGAALAVPGFIVWAWFSAKNAADVEMSKYKAEQASNPTTKNVIVNDYELKEVDDSNRIRWQLKAKRGKVLGETNSEVALEGVTMVYKDPETGDNKMRLEAPEGQANQVTRYVKLVSVGNQRVSAIGQGGKAQMIATVLELEKDNKFKAHGGVNIVWPEVAKVTGESANGVIDLPDFKNFKIVGNTHAEIIVK